MKLIWLKPQVIWGFLVLVGLWGSGVVWAGPDQSPVRQGGTVPTRQPPTNTPVPAPPTNTPVPVAPTNTSVPPTSLPNAPTATPPLPTIAFTPTAAQPVATAKENLRIRAAPATDGVIIGQLAKGTSAVVVGRTAANDWWQIPLPTNPNVYGWVSAAFADTNGPIESVPVVEPGSSPRARFTATATAESSTETPVIPTETTVLLVMPSASPTTGLVAETAPDQASPDAASLRIRLILTTLVLAGGVVFLVVAVGIIVFLLRSTRLG